ncbi:NH(3)-dependent NAD(+) synthetase [Rhizobiales bacterium GAS191]|nr:NH(3)-dependent NAD(+) synthetase [Rhizobiales bacterium GAS191]
MTQTATELSIALAQLNPTIGDVAANLAKARLARASAAGRGADIVMFPELYLSAYGAQDLVLKPAFQAACRAALEALARDTADGGPAILVGLPYAEGGKLYNAYAFLQHGKVESLRFKVDLPNYGVFDEKRVFTPGPPPRPILFRGVEIGIPICEDIWGQGLLACFRDTQASLLLVPNGSPYWRDKTQERIDVVRARVRETGMPLVYLNQVGGQDEIVFDGASFALDHKGELAASLPAFEEEVALLRYRRGAAGWELIAGPRAEPVLGDEADYTACMLGLRDYVGKNGFPGVVFGLSGGIDSALCAALAVDALGPERVHAVMLPYRYTSSDSLADAASCAERLGLRYDIVPIAAPVEGFEVALAPLFAGRPRDVTEENLQARARGTMLMSISNKSGAMLVTTGNKSEMSVGYATLYGDMNGGFNPIKDLYKTQVYRLAALRNRWKPKGAKGPDGPVIPDNVLVKAPTAELRQDQKDEDSLPPYEILDPILNGLVEDELSVSELVAKGYDEKTVRRVERLLALAEYKRRQAAPGPKVTRRNFGRDRRYPITNGFREDAPIR